LYLKCEIQQLEKRILNVSIAVAKISLVSTTSTNIIMQLKCLLPIVVDSLNNIIQLEEDLYEPWNQWPSSNSFSYTLATF